MTDKEEKFFGEVSANDIIIDNKLDEISQGLQNLKEVALNINTELNIQQNTLTKFDEELDETNESFDSINKKITSIANKTNPCTVCCILILVLSIIALIGYLLA